MRLIVLLMVCLALTNPFPGGAQELKAPGNEKKEMPKIENVMGRDEIDDPTMDSEQDQPDRNPTVKQPSPEMRPYRKINK